MKEPVDFHPGHGRQRRGYPKTRDPGTSTSIDKDICLEQCECVVGARAVGERTILRFP